MARFTCPECKSLISFNQRTCSVCGCILYWSRLLYRSALLIILAGACMVFEWLIEGGMSSGVVFDVLIGAAFVFGSAGMIVGCIALIGSAFSHERFKRTKRSSGQHPMT